MLARRIKDGVVKGTIACELGTIDIILFDAVPISAKDTNHHILATFKYGAHSILIYKLDGTITNDTIGCDPEKYKLFILLQEEEIDHEFKPFERVLVRNNNSDSWICSYFSHTSYLDTHKRYYVCMGNYWNQCIPYEGNEELLGTSNKK